MEPSADLRAEKIAAPVVIRVFAAPVRACGSTGNPWAGAARALERRVRARYGDGLRVEFIEIFSPEFFEHQQTIELLRDGSAQLPVVTVNDRIVQSGGKLSDRCIRHELERLGLRPSAAAGSTATPPPSGGLI